jgi:hypothetical protein
MSNHKKEELFVAYILLILDFISQIPDLLWNFDHAIWLIQFYHRDFPRITMPTVVYNFIYETQPAKTLMQIRSAYTFFILPLILNIIDIAISAHCIKKATKCHINEEGEQKTFRRKLLVILSIFNIVLSLIGLLFFTPTS